MMNQPNATAGTGDFEFAALAEAVNYRRAVIGEFSPFLRGRVLEIGAGIGQTSEEILALAEVEELVGLEPDPRFQPAFRERLAKVRLVAGTSLDLAEGEQFDATVMVNVLEHIDDDGDELARIRKLLAANRGHVCILVPARPEIYSKLDAHFGHFRRYTRAGLRTKLQQAGFDLVHLSYFNFIGYFAWAICFKIMQGMSFDPARVRLFDRRIFPIAHAIESRLIRPPIGQSLLAVAKAR